MTCYVVAFLPFFPVSSSSAFVRVLNFDDDSCNDYNNASSVEEHALTFLVSLSLSWRRPHWIDYNCTTRIREVPMRPSIPNKIRNDKLDSCKSCDCIRHSSLWSHDTWDILSYWLLSNLRFPSRRRTFLSIFLTIYIWRDHATIRRTQSKTRDRTCIELVEHQNIELLWRLNN